MRKLIIIVALIFLFQFILNSQSRDRYAQNQLIIQFHKSLNYADSDLKKGMFNVPAVDRVSDKLEFIESIGIKQMRNTFLLHFSENVDILKLVKSYSKLKEIKYAEPNFIGKGHGMPMEEMIPSDSFFERQWSMFNDGSFSLGNVVPNADIDMELAWDIENGSSEIIVAILDSGIKLDHPELTNRLWQNPNESMDGTDSDSNGYIDDINGYDFAYKDNDPSDDYGHGTNVTGILAANANNDIGYAGVDWNCQVMTLKVLDVDNFGFYSWWSEAIIYAVDHGAKILNMSLGGDDFSNLLLNAVEYAYDRDVTIVCSSGNGNGNIQYPAAYETTIAVGSTDPDDSRSVPFFWNSNTGSNFGSQLDLVAPGNYIYGLDYISNTNYNLYWGGTSQASPHVAGVASLLLSQNPGRTPDDIKNILISSAVDLVGPSNEDTAGWDPYFGHGRLNAHIALNGTVSNENITDLSEIIIYPNPSSDRINVTGVEHHSMLKTFTKDGKLIFQKELSSVSSEQIEIDKWPNGLLFIHIVDINNMTTVHKFIKGNN